MKVLPRKGLRVVQIRQQYKNKNKDIANATDQTSFVKSPKNSEAIVINLYSPSNKRNAQKY